MNVLVVEDERLTSWSLSASLAKWGFDVRSVFTGQDALHELQKSGFDIVLLDYQLPDVDGLQIAKYVREVQPDATILLVTGFQRAELKIAAGLIDEYFNKPLDMGQLHHTLTRIAKGENHGAK